MIPFSSKRSIVFNVISTTVFPICSSSSIMQLTPIFLLFLWGTFILPYYIDDEIIQKMTEVYLSIKNIHCYATNTCLKNVHNEIIINCCTFYCGNSQTNIVWYIRRRGANGESKIKRTIFKRTAWYTYLYLYINCVKITPTKDVS